MPLIAFAKYCTWSKKWQVMIHQPCNVLLKLILKEPSSWKKKIVSLLNRVITSLVVVCLGLLAVFVLSHGDPPWSGDFLSSSVAGLGCFPAFRLEDGVMVDGVAFGLSKERPLGLGSALGRRSMVDPSVLVGVWPDFASSREGPSRDGGSRGLRSIWVADMGEADCGDLIRIAYDRWDVVAHGHCGGGFSAVVRALGGGSLAAAARAHGAGGLKLFGDGVGVPIAAAMHWAIWALIWVRSYWTIFWFMLPDTDRVIQESVEKACKNSDMEELPANDASVGDASAASSTCNV